MRGMATATPTSAGSLGDIYLNSTPSVSGAQSWVCTTAGNSGAAVYTPVILGYTAQLANAYAAGAPTATGYINIKDSSGTTYKVLVST